MSDVFSHQHRAKRHSDVFHITPSVTRLRSTWESRPGDSVDHKTERERNRQSEQDLNRTRGTSGEFRSVILLTEIMAVFISHSPIALHARGILSPDLGF